VVAVWITARLVAVDPATKIIRFSLLPHILSLENTAARFDQRSKKLAIRSMFAVWRLILQRRDASSQQRRVFFPVT